MKGIKAAVLEERLCAQPLPESSSTAQDDASRAESEQEQKEIRLRERKAGKEKRRQQAREKGQQQASKEAGAGAMEPPPPAEPEVQEKKHRPQAIEKGQQVREDDGAGAMEAPPPAAPQVRSPSATTVASGNEAVPPPGMTLVVDGAAADEDMCVICYDAPVSVQLVHANETSHLCVCVGCSDILKARGDPCPACRAPIVMHLKNMYKMAQAVPGV
jgi:hypothetical protein